MQIYTIKDLIKLSFIHYISKISTKQAILLYIAKQKDFIVFKREAAPGEARTHGLQIMRLTRCLLRYRGFSGILVKI